MVILLHLAKSIDDAFLMNSFMLNISIFLLSANLHQQLSVHAEQHFAEDPESVPGHSRTFARDSHLRGFQMLPRSRRKSK